MRTGIKRLLKRQRATALLVTAVSMTVLMGFAALAVDLGYLYTTRGELQRAADAAALAGADVMFTENGLDVSGTKSTAAMIAAMNIAAQEGVILTPEDIEIGRFYDPLDLSCPFVAVADDSANAVRVTGLSREIDLFFGGLLGVSSRRVSADATAARVPVDEAAVVPIALRSPDFGPVNPDIAEQNPGKDGPSCPSNGYSFELGEEVVVFLFGTGPRPPVHLTLDLPEYSGVAETQKMLSGESSPVSVSVGDEMLIWNQGSGDGNFGVKLVDRLQNDTTADDTVVMPIVEPSPNWRNEEGDLVGYVRIADFVGVHLERVESVSVQDPRFPDDPTKTLVIDRLVGRVVRAIVSDGHGTSVPGPYGGGTVVMLQLVR
jgi:hypothetical protein